ncbi:ferric reductase-like transmembrane domain-containing protein [Ancylobacter sp. 6x-1]|uniref:Protein-methionine-sulfoxide reductase heme-binding subunit MsrQ n=1 Tax=Ancylobacter crimeensis TaxID=2579147 RepID=A0ABT0DE93_9HYPH|nr:ferric reductase-like transmembrane domain-containing protein [Ancylobacter crimeensis]MCK0198261.1 ferric reductase-like transmembrane domain-containing protein [Ancylobacter crimeensis]
MPFLRERSGRLSPEKVLALLVALLPAALLAWRAFHGEFSGFSFGGGLDATSGAAPGLGGPGLGGPGLGGSALGGTGPDTGLGSGAAGGGRPLVTIIRFIGDWTVRLLLITLAITPARRLFNWPKLLLARRTLGVAALAWLLVHFGFYIADMGGNLGIVAREIAVRIYLTIGFVALLAFLALGLTSTDAAIRRLGAERWNRLHALIYPATALGILHFFMQQKLDVTEPTLMAGLFVWLMGWRLLQGRDLGTSTAALLGLAIAAGLATAGLEAAWYGLATGVDPHRVLAANLAFEDSIRPAWWVASAGVVAALASAIALRLRPLPARRTARA